MCNSILHLFINVSWSSANPNISLHKTKDSATTIPPLLIPNNGVFNKIHPISTLQNTAIATPTRELSFVNRCFGQIVKLCRPTILGRTQPSVPDIQPVKVETVPFKPDYRTTRLKQFFLKFLFMRKINAYLLNTIPRGIWYEPLKTINKPIQNVNDLTIDQTLVFRELRRDGRQKNKKYLIPGGYTGLNYCTRYMYTKSIDNEKQNNNIDDEVND